MAGVIGQDLHLPAECLVFAGVLQVVSGLGAAVRDPVGVAQGPTGAHEGLTAILKPSECLGQVGAWAATMSGSLWR